MNGIGGNRNAALGRIVNYPVILFILHLLLLIFFRIEYIETFAMKPLITKKNECNLSQLSFIGRRSYN